MITRSFFTAALVTAGALAASVLPATAQEDCRQDHVTQPGDSLISIAQTYLGDRKKWSTIYYANTDAIGTNLTDLPIGLKLSVPCLTVEPASVVVEMPLLVDKSGINLLTGGNYAPFTDQQLANGGMIVELVNAAMEETPNPLPYTISWDDDWSQHLFPKLNDKQYDMGFPWLRPDCQATPDNERCVNFHFSDPLFDILILAFSRADSDFEFGEDADMHGRTLCRPEGYFTHDLDREGRAWLSENLITLVQPADPQACFRLLQSGEVDVVSLNEFLGWEVATGLGMRDAVKASEAPISSESLHIVISKRHWRGTTNMYRLNAGLRNLRGSDRYSEIVQKHMTLFWDGLN